MRTNKPLFLIVASAAVTASIPSWGATLDANVESFLTSDFNLVTSDVQFRFTELAPASGDNLSTHILIDGLVPAEPKRRAADSSKVCREGDRPQDNPG
jgi:hypothetical protein